jgi:hypothetical protein
VNEHQLATGSRAMASGGGAAAGGVAEPVLHPGKAGAGGEGGGRLRVRGG